MTIAQRLTDLGIELPKAAAPVASYQPLVVHGDMAYLSGQLPFIDGELVTGKLGKDVDLDRGQAAARACGLMIVAQLDAAGLLERVERIVKLGGFVASVPEFTDQPKVVNGASDLMAEIFGNAGKHARSAVGVPVLPLNAAVEVDAIIALKGA
ncbi:MAG: RidA family protein [Erythrobacter sp.]|nr:RidA family protein [Erythrobacter sp.]